jgi:pentatricopeptide repeat protein
MCGYFTHGLAGGARLRERVFHSQSVAEVFHQVDQYFQSMIERGCPPDAGPGSSKEAGVFIDRGPRDPKCAEFTQSAPAAIA